MTSTEFITSTHLAGCGEDLNDRLSPSVARSRVFALGAALLVSMPLQAGEPAFEPGSEWALPATATDTRWLEIRDVERTPTGTVYHISILSRKRRADVWNVQHLTTLGRATSLTS